MESTERAIAGQHDGGQEKSSARGGSHGASYAFGDHHARSSSQWHPFLRPGSVSSPLLSSLLNLVHLFHGIDLTGPDEYELDLAPCFPSCDFLKLAKEMIMDNKVNPFFMY